MKRTEGNMKEKKKISVFTIASKMKLYNKIKLYNRESLYSETSKVGTGNVPDRVH